MPPLLGVCTSTAADECPGLGFLVGWLLSAMWLRKQLCRCRQLHEVFQRSCLMGKHCCAAPNRYLPTSGCQSCCCMLIVWQRARFDWQAYTIYQMLGVVGRRELRCLCSCKLHWLLIHCYHSSTCNNHTCHDCDVAAAAGGCKQQLASLDSCCQATAVLGCMMILIIFNMSKTCCDKPHSAAGLRQEKHILL